MKNNQRRRTKREEDTDHLVPSGMAKFSLVNDLCPDWNKKECVFGSHNRSTNPPRFFEIVPIHDPVKIPQKKWDRLGVGKEITRWYA